MWQMVESCFDYEDDYCKRCHLRKRILVFLRYIFYPVKQKEFTTFVASYQCIKITANQSLFKHVKVMRWTQALLGMV